MLKVPRSYSFTLLASAGLASLGAVSLIAGMALPPYSVDEAAAELAFMNWCSFEGHVSKSAGDQYWSYLTYSYPLQNVGVGLLLAAVTMTLLAKSLAVGGEPGALWFRSPSRRGKYLLLGILVLAIFWLASMISLIIDQQRRLFPICADSIAIPMTSITVLLVVMSPIFLAAGWGITRGFAPLPVGLGAWDSSRPKRSLVISLIFGAPILIFGMCLLLSLVDSMTAFSSPAAVLTIYLLEATRSALTVRGKSAFVRF